ncbi:MAG: hypothetical protein HY558_05435 [Euryarchaeota archaeon]|nr:hypothetical protein [Euryarchaeota archaeon]
MAQQEQPAAEPAPETPPKGKKKGGKKKICLIAFLIALAVAGGVGFSMLQPRAAQAATVDPSVLQANGWQQVGGVATTSQEQKASGITVKINTASTSYTRDLTELKSKARTLGVTLPEDTSQLNQVFTFRADRVALPAIADLPMFKSTAVDQLAQVAESQFVDTVRAAGVSDFQFKETQRVTGPSGRTLQGKVFEGTFATTLGSTPLSGSIRGFQAVSSDGPLTVISGVVPGSIKMGARDVSKLVGHDGDKEWTGLLQLAGSV